MKRIIITTLILSVFSPSLVLACTWYDTGDPAASNGTEIQNDSSWAWYDNSGILSLPAGTVSQLRVYLTVDTFGQGLKLALFNGSKNLVVSDTNISEGTGAGWKTVTVTNTSVSSGIHYVGISGNASNADMTYATLTGQPSGTEYVVFSGGYASGTFPPSSMPAPDVNRTAQFYVGACVTPSASAASSIPRLIIQGVHLIISKARILII